jgi:hypothetical protein
MESGLGASAFGQEQIYTLAQTATGKQTGTAPYLREVIKYSSKIFTKPTTKEEEDRKILPTIYVSALHNILVAMKGLRIFDRFGFDLPQGQAMIQRKANVVFEFQDWDFEPLKMDWVNTASQKPLTDFAIAPELSLILSHNMDLILE